MRALDALSRSATRGTSWKHGGNHSSIQSLRTIGLSVDVVDMRGIPMLKYLLAIPRIRRLAKRADVIHAHFGYCGWLGRLAPALMRARGPLVVSFMGDDLLVSPYNAAGDLEWFSKLMIPANKVLAKISRAGHRQKPADGRRDPTCTIDDNPQRCRPRHVCPFDRQAARRELELSKDRKLVLFPSDPDNPRKRIPVGRRSHRVAAAVGHPIGWSIVGVAPRSADYMNTYDLMLMTSLIEGSPNVVKEAMACNLPIIGVPVGDVPEMLDGVLGCTLCERDPAAIAARAAAWLNQPGAVNGRDVLIRRGLHLASVARRVIAVYERAAGCVPIHAEPNKKGHSRWQLRLRRILLVAELVKSFGSPATTTVVAEKRQEFRFSCICFP